MLALYAAGPSAQLEQVYLRILRGREGADTVARRTARSSDNSFDTERAVVPAHVTSAHPVAASTLTSFVGRDTEVSQPRFGPPGQAHRPRGSGEDTAGHGG